MTKTVRIRGERREPLDKQRFLTALVAMARLKAGPKATNKENTANVAAGDGDAK